MFDQNKLKKSIFSLALIFLVCVPAFSQQLSDRQRKTSEQGRNEYGVEQAPDLTQENLRRVAASATQIRSVLVKDEGLMVELKRWVAKEATDSGQIVEDSNLTDQAIFERLEQDVAFRSVATRLLQRYGYLIPTPNPDSDFAKQKELVLKERARRLVQIESQEDTESLSNALQRAIRITTKIAHSNHKQTAAETLAHLTGCLPPRRTLRKQRQSNNQHKVRRGFCERMDYRRLRIRWMVRAEWVLE